MNSGKHSVFISRDLSANSVFRSILEAEGFAIEAWSYLDFKPLAFEFDDPGDWLFFYSPRGVQYFFEQEAPASLASKLAVMGNGTLNALLHMGLQADFIGKGQPSDIVKRFMGVLENGEKIDFIQAKHSQNSIALLLPEGIEKNNRIVYHNFKKPDLPKPQSTILVFTSPLNFEAYWEQAQQSPSDACQKKYLAIGPTTQAAMRIQLEMPVSFPKYPSEQDLAQLVLHQIR
ncbi:MAG: uroporphyrinogen-III synthase [Bacteroidota bacterium]